MDQAKSAKILLWVLVSLQIPANIGLKTFAFPTPCQLPSSPLKSQHTTPTSSLVSSWRQHSRWQGSLFCWRYSVLLCISHVYITYLTSVNPSDVNLSLLLIPASRTYKGKFSFSLAKSRVAFESGNILPEGEVLKTFELFICKYCNDQTQTRPLPFLS